MSIESNIAELTAAVKELTAAILAGQGKESCAGKCIPGGAEAKPPKAETKKSEPVQTAKQEAASTQPTATAQETAPDAKAENSAKPLDYEKDVMPLFLQLVNTPAATEGRPAAIALINSFKPGAAKLSLAITPDQYAEAIERIKAAIEVQKKMGA